MKSVMFLTNKKTKHDIIQIDLDKLANYPAEAEDILDIIITASRRNETSISFKKAKRILEKAGKI